jgi:transcriptional repressor NrdR
VPQEKIEALVDAIESELADSDKKELPSKEIGERAMVRLRALDEVAYVRFASVYRSFRDIDEFRSELDKMARTRSEPS